ncbi:MAG: rhodanese-like domain-containing protein [Coprobacillus sp.]
MNNSINPKLLYQIIDQDAYFIDIRDVHQFNNLHVKNFINMTKEELAVSLQSFSKNKPIYLMCYQGIGTKDIVNQIRSLGYMAYYVEGGFQAFLNLNNNQYF